MYWRNPIRTKQRRIYFMTQEHQVTTRNTDILFSMFKTNRINQIACTNRNTWNHHHNLRNPRHPSDLAKYHLIPSGWWLSCPSSCPSLFQSSLPSFFPPSTRCMLWKVLRNHHCSTCLHTTHEIPYTVVPDEDSTVRTPKYWLHCQFQAFSCLVYMPIADSL